MPAKAFVNSKYDLLINLSGLSQDINDFTELTLTMDNTTVPATPDVVLSMTGGAVTVTGNGNLSVEIGDTDVTVAGQYNLVMTGTIAGQNTTFTFEKANTIVFHETGL